MGADAGSPQEGAFTVLVPLPLAFPVPAGKRGAEPLCRAGIAGPDGWSPTPEPAGATDSGRVARTVLA